MKQNVGNLDRTLRLLAAALIAVLYFAHVISGTLAIVLLVVAAIFIVTSFINFCPIYAIFGLSTSKNNTSNPS
jgi:hypothetical protein